MTSSPSPAKGNDVRRPAGQYVGSRLRALRAERGLSQVRLAADLGISASYLNQIEHDTRPLTAPVLGRISEVFGIDARFFDPQDDIRLVAELREALIEEHVEAAETATDPQELADMVAAHPAIAEAVVNLHRRYRVATDQLAAVIDERGDRSMRGSISAPHEEVRDFFSAHHNYFHDLDVAAEEMVTRMRMHSGDVRAEIGNRLETVHGVQIVRRVDLGDDVLHRLDAHTGRLEVSAALGPGQRTFKLTSELAYLEYGDLMRKLVEEANFTSDDARTLAMSGLANYVAAAAVMPYEQFHGAAEDFRYDIERLSAFYSLSYETICHRLSTLQRPNLRGIPWSFVRVDRAGNMSKRQSATGFHFRQWRHLPAVERVRDLRLSRQDPHPGRADARWPRILLGGAHRGAARRTLRPAGQDLRHRAGLRTAPRGSRHLLRRPGDRAAGAGHPHRFGLPDL